MSKTSSSEPATPDPYATASAQTSSNVNTAIANSWLQNANEVSPLGSVDYSKTGSQQINDKAYDANGNWTGGYNTYDIPTFTRTTTYSPEEQAKLTAQQNLQLDLYDVAQNSVDNLGQSLEGSVTGFDSAGYLEANPDVYNWAVANGQDPNVYAEQHWNASGRNEGRTGGMLPTAVNDISGYIPELETLGNDDYEASRKAVEEAYYARLNPELERDKAALDVQLTNEGFTRGSAAYDNAMDEYTRQANDARNEVVKAGGEEQSRLFGMDVSRMQNNNSAKQAGFSNQLQSATFANTSRERALQERTTDRNMLLNQISALMSGSQVNAPSFTPYQSGSVASTPVGNYVYQGYNTDSQNYQSDTKANATTNAGLFGAGSNLLTGLFKLSDRKVKRDVVRIGELREGVGLYRYRYNWSDQIEIGVLAQEVLLVKPEAVAVHESGYLMVNYAALDL